MSTRKHKYRDAAEAAQACARDILSQLETALAEASTASLAISGGRGPVPMFEELAHSGFAWDRVQLFWVDERGVPPGDPQSNYRLANECFIGPAGFPARNVHRIEAELPPDEAAARYASEIQKVFALSPGELPRFDVVHRGMGPDAHTASLFPGEPLIQDQEGIAAAVWVEKMSQWRITLLPGVLRNAGYTVVLAAGEDKAEALRNVLSGPYEPLRYPAQLGLHTGRIVTWFFDEAAARLLG